MSNLMVPGKLLRCTYSNNKLLNVIKSCLIIYTLLFIIITIYILCYYIFTNNLAYIFSLEISNISWLVLLSILIPITLLLLLITYKNIKKIFFYITNSIINYFTSCIYLIIFKTIEDSKQPCLILDKKLNIIYINKKGREEFKFYNHNISRCIPSFHYSTLLDNNFNFKYLNPKLYNKLYNIKNNNINNFLKTLTINLNSKYTNKFIYNNVAFDFTARSIEITSYKIGLVVEFQFQKLNQK